MRGREEWLRPGEPLPEADMQAVADFDDALRAIGCPEQAVNSWVWESAAGLLEAASIPRGVSEWVWNCVPVIGPARWVQMMEDTVEAHRSGPESFEIRPMEDLLIPMAQAWPEHDEAVRRFAAFAHALSGMDVTGAPGLVAEMQAIRSAILGRAGVEVQGVWVVHRRGRSAGSPTKEARNG